MITTQKCPVTVFFSFLFRIDIKRHSRPQDFFLVTSTGDMLENKPILSTTSEIDPKSNVNKTEIKKPSSNKHVIELSCDSYNGLLSSTESKTLTRLNGLIGDNMVAFVKAKEEFKRKRSLPGILYRYDSIRRKLIVGLQLSLN